jgi:pimeloyl-ACP methyl ester carboxylesterase
MGTFVIENNVDAGGGSSRAARLAVRILLVLALIAAGPVLAIWRSPLWVASKVVKAQLYLAGIHSDSISVDAQELHYLEGGSGDAVVLVHGLGGSAQQDWANLMPHLVRSGHHVYAMDLPGFGDSPKPADRSYSIAEQAGLVEAFLDAKQLMKVTLGGESMGGWIAATVALEQPQRISQLMLFDSAGLSFKPSFDVALFTPRTHEQVDALMAILIPQPPSIPAYVKEDLLRRTARDGWVIERALASMQTGVDLLDKKFSSLKMPLLLVWGKQDVLTPLSIGEAMHRAVPQSVLAVYDGCGHIAVQTCTDRIAPMTVSFLDGTLSQAGRTIEVPKSP